VDAATIMPSTDSGVSAELTRPEPYRLGSV